MTKVSAQRINGLKLDILGIVIPSFFMEDKEEKYRFFEKTFLLVNISIDIAFKILFLILSNIKIDFNDCYLLKKTYTAVGALPTMRRGKLIGKKKFVTIIFDSEDEAFVVHITPISQESHVHHSKKAHIALFKADEAFITISPK